MEELRLENEEELDWLFELVSNRDEYLGYSYGGVAVIPKLRDLLIWESFHETELWKVNNTDSGLATTRRLLGTFIAYCYATFNNETANDLIRRIGKAEQIRHEDLVNGFMDVYFGYHWKWKTNERLVDRDEHRVDIVYYIGENLYCALECDEKGHCRKTEEEEASREHYIRDRFFPDENILKFWRFNPDDDGTPIKYFKNGVINWDNIERLQQNISNMIDGMFAYINQPSGYRQVKTEFYPPKYRSFRLRNLPPGVSYR